MRSDSERSNSSRSISRIAFVTNICPHYRVKTFETLAKYYPVKFFFYSKGTEWYWLQKHGTRQGLFDGEYLAGAGRGEAVAVPSLLKRLWERPYLVFIKCINGRLALPATYLTARLRRKPFILWTGIWQNLQTPFHKIILPITRFVYRHADAIVVYGEHVKRFLVDQGVDPNRVFIAHHAVDNELYARPVSEKELCSLRENLSLKKTDRPVLYVGRFEEVKGLVYLLQAFAQASASDSVLILVGEGSEKPILQRLAKQLGIDARVRFVGYLSPEDAIPYYALSYLLVLPSVSTARGKEPWGLVVNEAMNQGLPVIATDAVGAAAGGLIRDGVNGLVVPERDATALAYALDRLLANVELRDQMSASSREGISVWNNERMVAGFRSAIESVLH